MKDKKGNVLNYTNRRHLKKTKRLKYQKLIANYKEKNKISEIENELSQYNSKTCDYDNFKNYTENKNRINKILLDEYKVDTFRKYKWYGYINRQKAESDLIKNIKNKFGRDVTIIYGDWSVGKQMRHKISTPNKGLKKRIAEDFIIYSIDEFRTSCLNHKTKTYCDNLYLPDKKGKIRKIHSVLTYEMENGRRGCINRDLNAVNNMIDIVRQYLKDKTRQMYFRRDIKKEEIEGVVYNIKPIKDTNPETLMKKIVIY